MPPAPARENLTRFAWLSIAAAVATIALKFGAYLLTGSVGLLSDAAESVVNLVAAFVALIALHVAAQPADVDHQFGHSKAEYFSAAVEGVMIFVAAIFILWSSVQRFFAPEPLENVGMGPTGSSRSSRGRWARARRSNAPSGSAAGRSGATRATASAHSMGTTPTGG